MSLLNDFPFEVLSLIFQKTWGLYLLDDPPLKKEPRRIFPFNVASVCSLWLDVLKSEPRYWKCVTFDVGYDPTPFLDTIGLYASGGIDVCVVSSRRSKVTELQEKSVVQKLYTHLKPHLPICSAIEFDLVFQSSLPSAADILTHDIPCLSSLSFRCEVHNCDDNSLDIKINANKKSRKKNPRSLTFPALRRLCLTGYSFMELRQLGEQWAEISITDLPQSSLHLSVNHFKFHEPGQWDDRTHSSLYVFLQTIELWTEYKNFELVLQDISTDYKPNPDHGQRSMSFTSIKFKDVSRDFISTFFGSFSAPSWRQLATVHFMGCSIPCIPKCAWSQTTTLIVGYTPFRRCSRSRSNIEERLSDSLCNAVFAFHPEHLLVRGCEELGDAFFNWYYREMSRYPSYHWRITSLDIAHCKEFSASALCKFVQYRILVRDRIIWVPSIRKLCVKGGQNTLLSKFDAQWFLDKKSYIHVDWTVSYEGEVGEEYLKTFHTHE